MIIQNKNNQTNPGQKVSDRQVIEMRYKYDGGESIEALATEYCLAVRTTEAICKRRTRKHVEGES